MSFGFKLTEIFPNITFLRASLLFDIYFYES